MLLCPPPRDLPDPGIEPTSLMSPSLAGRFCFFFFFVCFVLFCFLPLMLPEKPFTLLLENNKSFLITLLEYSRFAELCRFLLYSKAKQLYVYIYSLFLGFPSI